MYTNLWGYTIAESIPREDTLYVSFVEVSRKIYTMVNTSSVITQYYVVAWLYWDLKRDIHFYWVCVWFEIDIFVDVVGDAAEEPSSENDLARESSSDSIPEHKDVEVEEDVEEKDEV